MNLNWKKAPTQGLAQTLVKRGTVLIDILTAQANETAECSHNQILALDLAVPTVISAGGWGGST